MKMSKKALILAAVSTLALTASGCASKTSSTAMGQCHGVNACKGEGACGGKTHDCAGKNSCKGKGWIKMIKGKCESIGGTYKKK